MIGRRLAAGAALAAWAGGCWWEQDGTWRSWLQAVDVAGAIRLDGVSSSGLAAALARHAAIPAAAGVMSWLLARSGGAVRGWLGTALPASWERVALDLLAGFPVFGLACFGAALAGVLAPATVAAAALLPACARRAPLRRAGPHLPRPSLPLAAWVAAAGVPALVAGVLMLLPDTDGDAYVYHLAAPARFLQAGRIAVEGAPLPFTVPLTAEFCNLPALLLGRDALAHFLQALPFAAGVTLVVLWAARLGGRTAGGLALGGILAVGTVGQLLVIAKNDLAATGYVLAGSVCAADGARTGARGRVALALALCGAGMGLKYTGIAPAAAVVAGLLAWRGARAFTLLPAALLAAPLLPWLVKDWLLLGDPVWPVLAPVLPGALWDRESGRALASVLGTGTPGYRWRDLPGEAMRTLATQMPVTAVMLPAGLVGAWRAGGELRWITAVALAGLAVSWEVTPLPGLRYALGSLLLLAAATAVVVGRAAAGWTPPVRRAAAAAALVAGWLPLGQLLSACVDLKVAVPCLLGGVDETRYRRERLRTYDDAIRGMVPAAAGRTVLVEGNLRGYGVPGRALFPRNYGRAWAWLLAGRCPDRARIRVQLRQLDCDRVLWNMAGDPFPNPASRPFPWRERELAPWRDFVARDLEVVLPPARLDPQAGAYCLFAVRPRPLLHPPAVIPYLPGIESEYDRVAQARASGDAPAWLAAAAALDARVPGVDAIRYQVAVALCAAGRWAEAWDAFAGGLMRGTVGMDSLWGAAVAAGRVGRLREAYALYGRAADAYPLYRRAILADRERLRAVLAGRREGGWPR